MMKRFLQMMLSAIVVLNISVACGQVCNIQSVNDMIVDYNNWDWELLINDPDYCSTWSARITTAPNTIDNIGSPFTGLNKNTTVDDISINQDYLKSDGWELLKKDMGTLSPVRVPYFILYNRHSGLLRVFFYYKEDVISFNEGILVTLSHGTSSDQTAILSSANEGVQAPINYYNNTALNPEQEMLIYKCNKPGQAMWMVAQFRPMLDFNIDSYNFKPDLVFDFYGIQSNTLMLDGTTQSFTKEFSLVESQSILESNGSPNLKKIVLNSRKKIKSVVKNDANEFLQEIKSNVTLLKNNTANSSSKTGKWIHSFAKNALKSNDSEGQFYNTIKSLKNISGVASGALGLVSFVGKVTGLFSEEKAGGESTFTPTVTSGTISLSGTMSLEKLLTSVRIYQPNISSFDPTQQFKIPYYDGTLGIFNISNPPHVNKKNYWKHTYYFSNQQSHFTETWKRFEEYKNITVTSHPNWRLNESSDLKVGNIEVCLMAKVASVVNTKEHHRFNYPLLFVDDKTTLTGTKNFDLKSDTYIKEGEPLGNGSQNRYYKNHLGDLLLENINEVGDVEEGEIKSIRTRYVDMSCAQGLSIDVPKNFDVYFRVKAYFYTNDDIAQKNPILFVEDFVLNETVISNEALPGWSDNQDLNLLVQLPTFKNYSYLPSTNLRTTLSGVQNGGADQIFNTNLVASNISVDATQDIEYVAGHGIVISPNSIIKPGNNQFVAKINDINFGTLLVCTSNNLVSTFVDGLDYNDGVNGAVKLSGNFTNAHGNDFLVYPNPSNGLVHTFASKAGKVIVFDALGREVLNQEITPHQLEDIDLSKYGNGLFILKYISTGEAITERIVVE